MDSSYRQQLKDMRRQSGGFSGGERHTFKEDSGENLHISEMSGLYFRCFLAIAFVIACIGFTSIQNEQIPEGLRHICDYVAVDYTVDDVVQWTSYIKP